MTVSCHWSILSVCSVMLFCAVAGAQQPNKITRIGYLSDSNATRESARAEAIRFALREFGYIEGQNIATEYRYADGELDKSPELAAELVRLKVNILIIAGGDTQIRAAKKATNTIPIIMTGSGADPVEAGFAESLARPAGNVTGITFLSRELGGKRLELLQQVVPKLVRVAVLYHPANRNNARELKDGLPVAARTLGLTIQTWPVRDFNDFEKVFAATSKQRPDGLYFTGGRQMQAIEKGTAGIAVKWRIPSVYSWSEAVDAGGLMYYGADLPDSYRRVAMYVDKIVKGMKAADLPIEQPTKFELVINLKTAKQIGLTIPPHVLARAHRVIR